MNREEAAAHEAGECLMGCSHPDHAFDDGVIDLGLFDDPEVMSAYVADQFDLTTFRREAAEEPVVL